MTTALPQLVTLPPGVSGFKRKLRLLTDYLILRQFSAWKTMKLGYIQKKK
jgi:hypothetical protein